MRNSQYWTYHHGVEVVKDSRVMRIFQESVCGIDIIRKYMGDVVPVKLLREWNKEPWSGRGTLHLSERDISIAPENHLTTRVWKSVVHYGLAITCASWNYCSEQLNLRQHMVEWKKGIRWYRQEASILEWVNGTKHKRIDGRIERFKVKSLCAESH